jgi:hypothetical protein
MSEDLIITIKVLRQRLDLIQDFLDANKMV